MHADGKGKEPQARRTRLVGWNGILARREVCSRGSGRSVRRAPRGVSLTVESLDDQTLLVSLTQT